MKAAGSAAQVRQALEISSSISCESLLGHRRLEDPVGPHAAPPGPVLVGGEGPVAGRRLDLLEACLQRPGEQAATGVGFAAVGAGKALVQSHPLAEFRQFGVPGESLVIGVPGRDDAAGLADATHLAKRLDRVGDVLQDLVCVDDVEGVVRQVEVVDVADDEVDRDVERGEGGTGDVERALAGLEGGGAAGLDEPGEVGRDGAGAGPDVEQGLAGPQSRQQVAGRVPGGAPAVRAQYGFVVAVRVDVLHDGLPCPRSARSG
jgi:hypothetical protein